ncbi:putative membrane protein [Mucilaginibacter yixingensis]|uniref:Putative membrane protein n=1 Tax=Mucilaginibacter yixingensis TaxID=1295612 RepID=A0A2T5J9I0_9SPHI|nr:DUF4126 family protein [Mucilaginibacter yixingensis]PTQ96716.1 putative membrane protein [Mucilaginibacter yixingensis]
MENCQTDRFYTQAAILGIVAGMRAMSAPAIAAKMLTRAAVAGNTDQVPAFLQSGAVNTALSLLAIAEYVGDKLPNAPNRTATPGIIARCVTGALSGAAICKVNKRNALVGALIGSGTALASTFGCFYLRKSLVQNSCLPDPTIGAMEDALVMSTGLALVSLV